MDHIQEIIFTFSEKERSEFRHFLIRQKHSESRKDLKLFNDFCKKDLEKVKSKNAGLETYHALRKRLTKQLADFIVVKQIDEDLSETGTITAWISLSRYLFENEIYDTAWKYIRKAEKLGIESERYDLLNSVYLLSIEFHHTGSPDSLDDIMVKMQQVRKMQDDNERIMFVTALIRKKLDECKLTASLQDFPAYVEKTLDRFELNKILMDRPVQLFRLMEIVRNTYLALRDMKNFEPFILEQFSQFEKVSSEKKQFHFYRLQFLYMVAHVLYRTRKFKQSLEYLEKLHEEMLRYDRRQYLRFYPRYISLISSINSLSGKNEKAIELHEKMLTDKKIKLNTRDYLNMRLNLAFFYFNAKDFRKANRLFLLHEHSDSWYEKKMGKEWVLRNKFIQLIIQYELGHEDIALQMIQTLQREYEPMFKIPQYVKAGNFLSMLKTFMNDPYKLSFEEYRKKAWTELFTVHPDSEESKAIAFYSWLKSKLTGKDYYKTLLEEVKLNEELV